MRNITSCSICDNVRKVRDNAKQRLSGDIDKMTRRAFYTTGHDHDVILNSIPAAKPALVKIRFKAKYAYREYRVLVERCMRLGHRDRTTQLNNPVFTLYGHVYPHAWTNAVT